MVRIDVCLCTHQPRRDVLAIALRALSHQTLARDAFRVLVIDNASAPALGAADVAALAGIEHRVIREATLGLAHARARAIRESRAAIVVFVDDDNELAPDYLARVLAIFDAEPALGCAGGRLLPATPLPRWLAPLRHYFAIRDDLGDAPLTELAAGWSLAMPAGAGMALRRAVCERYLACEPWFGALGRRGVHDIGSCEDVVLAAQAKPLGLACGYRPELSLVHHVDPRRFAFRYLLRMFFGQGRSEAHLESALGPIPRAAFPDRLQLAALREPRVVACLAARAAGHLSGSADMRRRQRPARRPARSSNR